MGLADWRSVLLVLEDRDQLPVALGAWIAALLDHLEYLVSKCSICCATMLPCLKSEVFGNEAASHLPIRCMTGQDRLGRAQVQSPQLRCCRGSLGLLSGPFPVVASDLVHMLDKI